MYAAIISGALHDLTFASHIRGSQGAGLASLLAQGARRAEPVDTAVADRRAFDVLGLTDVGADATLAEKADARTADEEQGVTEARAASCLSHLTRRVTRTEPRDEADRKVAETAAQVVLERCHSLCM